MSSRSLAQVELQLIMQQCDLKSLLFYARCCKENLRAASNEFAWSTLSPLIFRSTRLHFANRLADSLLRFSQIGVRWCSTSRGAAEVVSLATIPHLCLLDFRNDGGVAVNSEQLWKLLTTITSPHHLTSLYAGCALNEPSIQFLKLHCPALRTLYLPRSDIASSISFLNHHLIQFPKLTDIGIRSYDLNGTSLLRSAPLFSFTGLLKLSIARVEVFYPQSEWSKLFVAPTMRSLQQLTFDRAHFGSKTMNWRDCFINLQSLQSLILDHCSGIAKSNNDYESNNVNASNDEESNTSHTSSSIYKHVIDSDYDLLPSLTLHASTSFRSLTVSLMVSSASSVALFDRLLTQRVDCSLILEIDSHQLCGQQPRKKQTIEAEKRAQKQYMEAKAERDRSYADYSTLSSRFPNRVTVGCNGPVGADEDTKARR